MRKLNCILFCCYGSFCSEAVILKWLSTARSCWERNKAAINPSLLFVIKGVLFLDVDGDVINGC